MLEICTGKVETVLDFEKHYSAVISGMGRMLVVLTRSSGTGSRMRAGAARSPFNLLGGEFVGLVPHKEGLSPLYIRQVNHFAKLLNIEKDQPTIVYSIWLA